MAVQPVHPGAEEPDWGILMTDLQNLVERGLLTEIRVPGEPSRYALSAVGQKMTALLRGRTERASDAAAAYEPASIEPCPRCGAESGYDGGARCLSCGTPWPPEM